MAEQQSGSGPAALPDRPAGRPTPRELLEVLAARVGEATAAALCAEVLAADSPDEHPDTVRFLGGTGGEALLSGAGGWRPYWARVWGARGLLYVWDEPVAPVVLAGLGDEAWRVAEMCLKVSALRELPAGDGAVGLVGHELPRVRGAAVRALGAVGDVEHVPAVRSALDDPDETVRRTAARALDRMSERLDLV